MNIQDKLKDLYEQRDIINKEISDLENTIITLKVGDVIRYKDRDLIENYWLIVENGMMVVIKGNAVGYVAEAKTEVPVKLNDSMGYEYAYTLQSENKQQ